MKYIEGTKHYIIRKIIKIIVFTLLFVCIGYNKCIFAGNLNDMTLEKFRDINNIYGKWRVKGCRIIGFNKDKDDGSYHQIKVSKQKEQEVCVPYIGKEMTITKELVDFDFGKCKVGVRCKLHIKNPEFDFREYNLHDSLPYTKEDFRYVIDNQHEYDLVWMVFIKDDSMQDYYPKSDGYYDLLINYTIFTNSLEIVGYIIDFNSYFDTFLVLEKVE